MHEVRVRALTAEAFAPFGTVLASPQGEGRDYYDDALTTHRAEARPSLSLSTIMAQAELPLTARQMERHAFSSQSFLPLATGTRYLVMVAPHGADDGPDMAATEAFVADGVGITYAADTWHHPMTVLAVPARFAVVMWLDGSDRDTDFVDIDPVRVVGG